MSDPTPKDEPNDADPPKWPDDNWQWDSAAAKKNEPDEPEATEATG